MIRVEGKVVGQRRPLFADWELPLDPDPGTERAVTLRELISRIVREEVAAYRLRQEERRFVRALTSAEIQQGITVGKVDPGGREELAGTVDAEAAVRTAIQAFEDGLYFVFVDDEQQTALDAPVPLRDSSRITFLRLVALAGG